jgi:uncharacterized membrane protein
MFKVRPGARDDMAIFTRHTTVLETEARSVLRLMLLVSAAVTLVSTLGRSLLTAQWPIFLFSVPVVVLQLTCVMLLRWLPSRLVAGGYFLLLGADLLRRRESA